MVYGNLFEQALNINTPWFISNIEFDADKKRMDIEIDFEKGATFRVDEDGVTGDFKVYDTTKRTWRHLNFFEYECYLHARVPRVKTKDGKTRTIKTPWQGKVNGFTLQLEAMLLPLCHCMAVEQVAKFTKINGNRIWGMLDKYVQEAFAQRDLDDIEVLGIDETSFRRRHDYITVFMDMLKKQTVFVSEGRNSDTISEFREVLELKNGNPKQIKEISMDMSKSFIKGVEYNFPEASITFDRFHIMRMLNYALNEVKIEDSKTNKILKGTKYIFMKNSENLNPKEKNKLEEITMANAGLNITKAYHYKEIFREIYKAESAEEFETLLKIWTNSVMHTNLKPLKKVVKTIRNHWDGIVNWAKTRINNGLLEGINSIIQSMKSRARGYSNPKYYITMVYLVTGKFDFRPLNSHYLPI